MRKILPILIIFIVSMLSWRELSLQPDEKLHIHFFDIGQGDASLLVTPSGKQILVDGGPDMSLLEHLGITMPFFDRTIEYMVLTHPDFDHLAALPDILRRYSVSYFILAGTHKGLDRYDEIVDLIKRKDIPVIFSQPGKVVDVGDGVTMKMLWPDATQSIRSVNDASVVVMIEYKDTRILLPGDIEEYAEVEILASGRNIQADILKIPHHGSRTSSSTGFILEVNPELAIVSAGAENRFGHPHRAILDRYESRGIAVRSTALEGTISLEFE